MIWINLFGLVLMIIAMVAAIFGLLLKIFNIRIEDPHDE